MTQKTIKLIKPHEHGGRLWPVDTKFTMDADTADWIISHKKAVEVDAPKDATKKGVK